MPKLVNLTGKPVRYFDLKGALIVLEPEDVVPASASTFRGEILAYKSQRLGIEVRAPTRYGEIEGLPPEDLELALEGKTFYIVPANVGLAAAEIGRGDVLILGDAPEDRPSRNGDGSIYAVRCFKRPG